jgi:hypothetical protein
MKMINDVCDVTIAIPWAYDNDTSERFRRKHFTMSQGQVNYLLE